MRIAIVGNGPSALKTEAGEFIDACDEVVRINRPEVGYEKFVGSRTTMRVFNGNPKCTKAMLSTGKPLNLILFCEHRASKAKLDNFLKHFTRKKQPFGIISKKERNMLAEGYKLKKGHRYTSGVLTIAYFIRKYPKDELFITGFDAVVGKSNPRHFWAKGKVSNLSKLHNLSAEADYIRSLIDEGRVHIIAEHLDDIPE